MNRAKAKAWLSGAKHHPGWFPAAIFGAACVAAVINSERPWWWAVLLGSIWFIPVFMTVQPDVQESGKRNNP